MMSFKMALQCISESRHLQTILAGILLSFLWMPTRTMLNQWRLHRRQKRYPQLVVCRIEKNHMKNVTNNIPGLGNVFQDTGISLVLRSMISFLLTMPLKLIQLVLSLIRPVVLEPSKHIPPINSTPQSKTTTTPVHKGTSPPLSVLRKAGTSSSIHSRVEFAELSNGHVRTERRYYLPHAQPNQSIQSPNAPSPQAIPPKRSEHSDKFLTPDWPRVRHQPAKLENLSVTLPSSRSPAAAPSLVQDHSSYAVVEYQSTHPSVAIAQAPLSEQMRKRRHEQGDEYVQAKRSSIGGRVGLAGTTPRIVATRRTLLQKREREEREDRILKDLNYKRIKNKEGTKGTGINPIVASRSVAVLHDSNSTATGSEFEGAKSASERDVQRAPTPASLVPTNQLITAKTDTAVNGESKTFAFSVDCHSSNSTDLVEGKSIKEAPSLLTLDVTPAAGSTQISTNSTSSSFGEKPSETLVAASAFSFGNTIDASAKAPANVASAASTGFSFGGTDAPEPSGQIQNPSKSVSFGSAPVSSSKAPVIAFQFGAPAPSSLSNPPSSAAGFSFGGASTSTDAPAPSFKTVSPTLAPTSQDPSSCTGFSFGGASTPSTDAPASAVTFGAPTIAGPSSSTGFSFGGTSVSSAAVSIPSFQFSAPSQAPTLQGPSPSTGFSFGGATVPSGNAPAPILQAPSSGASFAFGESSAASSSMPPSSQGFSFGGSQASSAPTFGSDVVTFTSDTNTSGFPQFTAPAADGFVMGAGGGGASARRRAKARTRRR